MPYWKLYYHFVWSTRNREPLIAAMIEDTVHHMIAAKARQFMAEVHAIGGVEDHVHLVVSVPPSLSLAEFIGKTKGSSSHWINRELDLPFKFSWQQEYGLLSFGPRSLDRIIRYVRTQRRHHSRQQLIGCLETRADERDRKIRSH